MMPIPLEIENTLEILILVSSTHGEHEVVDLCIEFSMVVYALTNDFLLNIEVKKLCTYQPHPYVLKCNINETK